jgi:hypothetical protein
LSPTDQTCAQCHGAIDGTERLVSVSGHSVWLHLECERFWLRAPDEGRGLEGSPGGLLDGWTLQKGEFGETRARHARVAFFGVEPFAPCDHCGKADGVRYHVRDNRHVGCPSVPLHEACVASWLALNGVG